MTPDDVRQAIDEAVERRAKGTRSGGILAALTGSQGVGGGAMLAAAGTIIAAVAGLSATEQEALAWLLSQTNAVAALVVLAGIYAACKTAVRIAEIIRGGE